MTGVREILRMDRKPVESVHQVWPNLYVGDEWLGRTPSSSFKCRLNNSTSFAGESADLWLATLSCLGATHVLNAAAGRHRINTGHRFYSRLEVEYHGVEAADHPEFHLQPFFIPAAQFIDKALRSKG